jgi:hypothetical protein
MAHATITLDPERAVIAMLRALLDMTPWWRWRTRARLLRRIAATQESAREQRKAAQERVYVLAASHHQFALFATRWARERAGRRLSNAVRLTPEAHAIDGVCGDHVVELPGADRARGYAAARALAVASRCTIVRVEP